MADAPDAARANVVQESADRATRFLSLLAAVDAPRISGDRIAVVVAHPDDDTIGVGGQLARFADVTVVHVTDGTPRRHPEWAAYAELRRRELETAMALAGVPADACVGLSFPDQEAALQLTSLATRLAALFSQRKIDIALTHPYEGGHPDHDATSFAVHGAGWLMLQRGERSPTIIEMAFYHAGSGGLSAQQFAPVAGVQVIAVPLSTAVWAFKQRMLSAHASQAGLATQFSASVERFRRAPNYDFSLLPNGGTVYYGSVDWGMTPARWCQLAADSLRELCWAQPSI